MRFYVFAACLLIASSSLAGEFRPVQCDVQHFSGCGAECQWKNRYQDFRVDPARKLLRFRFGEDTWDYTVETTWTKEKNGHVAWKMTSRDVHGIGFTGKIDLMTQEYRFTKDGAAWSGKCSFG